MSKNATPWIQTVTLNPPSLKDNTADADRLIQALKSHLNTDAVDIDLDLVKALPAVLRRSRFKIRCILFKEGRHWTLTGISEAKDANVAAGLAVDLGTTRVVMRLLDLSNGRTLAESAFDNPQDSIGPDILARIHFTEKENGLKKLNELIISGLNDAIEKICKSQQISSQQIYALSVAGNTTMTHLFLDLDPRWIIREPYIPVVNNPGVLKARGTQTGSEPTRPRACFSQYRKLFRRGFDCRNSIFGNS